MDEQRLTIEEFDALTKRIVIALESSQFGQVRQIAVLLNALTSLLARIGCQECRQLIRKHIEDSLPGALDEAMQWASEEDHLHHHLH
jgi:hypothetical protein